MKFINTALLVGIAATKAMGQPLEDRNVLEDRDVQVAHLTFHAGPVSYTLNVTADGSVVPTNSDLSVNIIDAPDYNALPNCNFVTDGDKTIVQSINTDTGMQSLIVGPPMPIRSVSCEGMCVPNYSDCYVNGQPVGACCNGFCAANKCRPWNGV